MKRKIINVCKNFKRVELKIILNDLRDNTKFIIILNLQNYSIVYYLICLICNMISLILKKIIYLICKTKSNYLY